MRREQKLYVPGIGFDIWLNKGVGHCVQKEG
jgi:hypothetical protein